MGEGSGIRFQPDFCEIARFQGGASQVHCATAQRPTGLEQKVQKEGEKGEVTKALVTEEPLTVPRCGLSWGKWEP